MRRPPPLLVVYSFVAIAFASAALAFFVLPGQLVNNVRFKDASTNVATEEKRLKARHDVRTVGVQLVGALALIVGAALTWRSVWLTREGQISDRLATAMLQLGGSDATQRVAAIHALGRAARDSSNDHAAAMALLGEHLRAVASAVDEDGKPRELDSRRGVDPEVQAVAMVLRARRSRWDPKEPRLNFTSIDFRNAPLQGVDLRRANLRQSNFRGAFLSDANLSGTWLDSATLKSANLQRSNLKRATLTGADLSFAHAEGAYLCAADLDEVIWAHTEFYGANLRKAKGLHESVRNPKFIASDTQTKWPRAKK